MKNKVMGFIIGCALVLMMAIPVSAFDIQLSWTHENPETVSEYRIYYSTVKGPGKTNKVPVVGGMNTEGEVLGLALGTTYYFHVTAVNQYGYESGASNEVWTDGTGEPGPGESPSGCFINVILNREEADALGE